MTNQNHESSLARSADSTLVKAALKKCRSATPVDVLESVVRMNTDPAYRYTATFDVHLHDLPCMNRARHKQSVSRSVRLYSNT